MDTDLLADVVLAAIAGVFAGLLGAAVYTALAVTL
jgi:hypothetical protein